MRSSVFALALFAVACVHLPLPAAGRSAPIRYSFTASGSFVTAATDAGGQAIPSIPEDLATSSVALRGELSREQARTMRDGSLGNLVRFGAVEMAESIAGPWSSSTLGGRSVELRTFDNGEILDIYEASHLAGTPRYGDVFDVLFLALSPVIPQVQPGSDAWRRGSWPFFASPERGLRTSYTTSFHNDGTVESPHGPATRLPYQGTFEARGQDQLYDAMLQAHGELSGTVWLGASDVSLLRNELRCTRVITARFESGVQLIQTQDLVVVVDRVEGP